jgi:hypothetical protein
MPRMPTYDEEKEEINENNLCYNSSSCEKTDCHFYYEKCFPKKLPPKKFADSNFYYNR